MRRRLTPGVTSRCLTFAVLRTLLAPRSGQQPPLLSAPTTGHNGLRRSWFISNHKPQPGERLPPETVKLIGTLVEQKRSDREIAAELNQQGLLSGVKRAWDKQAVRWVRRRYGIPRQPAGRRGRPRQPERRADGLYSTRGVAALLDVSEAMVRSWVEKGWLRCVEGGGPGHPQWFKLDRSTLERLKTARAQGMNPAGSELLTQISVEEGGAL